MIAPAAPPTHGIFLWPRSVCHMCEKLMQNVHITHVLWVCDAKRQGDFAHVLERRNGQLATFDQVLWRVHLLVEVAQRCLCAVCGGIAGFRQGLKSHNAYMRPKHASVIPAGTDSPAAGRPDWSVEARRASHWRSTT